MKISNQIPLLFICVIALFTLALSGCQTADGMGQDIENLGESIQD